MIGFAAAAVVHFGTFAGSPIRPAHPLFWGLHFGVFPLFILMVLRLRAWQGESRGALDIAGRRLRWRELRPWFPSWATTLGILLFAYAAVNFLAASHLGRSAQAVASRGAQLPPEQAGYVMRAFSGHWLVFYGLPTLFFLFVPAAARPASPTPEAAV
jgi:ABC-type branched-subunit amino acid transport system permease subunit